MLERFANVKDFPVPGRPGTDFPTRAAGGFVYLLCWVGEQHEVPFYVVETSRFNERIDDYCSRHFTAPTDFRVGEAVCYLRDMKGFRIVVRYKPSFADRIKRRREEYLTIRNLQTSGARLLNDLVSYSYNNATQEDERSAIHTFCDILVRDSSQG
jgi:hypothetical protein